MIRKLKDTYDEQKIEKEARALSEGFEEQIKAARHTSTIGIIASLIKTIVVCVLILGLALLFVFYKSIE